MTFRWAIVLGLAACGGGGGGGGNPMADAAPTVPPIIHASGTISSAGLSGRSALAGVMIGSYPETATAPTATTMTDAAGKFSIAIPTNGQPVVGYLLAQKAGYKDAYLYPSGPLTEDTTIASGLMLTPSTFDLVGTLTQTTQTPGMAFLGLEVLDPAGNSVAGATVTTSPAGVVHYDANGLPSKTATVTDADGVAFIFNVPPGDVTISATGGTVTYKPTTVHARADQMTETYVQP